MCITRSRFVNNSSWTAVFSGNSLRKKSSCDLGKFESNQWSWIVSAPRDASVAPELSRAVPVHLTLLQPSEGGLRSLQWVGTQAAEWLQEIKRALLRWNTCSHSVHFCLAKCQTQPACTHVARPKISAFLCVSVCLPVRVCVCGCATFNGRRVKAETTAVMASRARRPFQFDAVRQEFPFQNLLRRPASKVTRTEKKLAG